MLKTPIFVWIYWYNSVKFFFKLKSNYIEKLRIETQKTLLKRFDILVANEIVSGMVWRRLWYSELKYSSVLPNLGRSVFFFFYSSQKPHSNHIFPRFNHSSIVTYVINNRWHHILSRQSNLVDSLQNMNLFLNCSSNNFKKLHIVVLLCLNVQTMRSQF